MGELDRGRVRKVAHIAEGPFERIHDEAVAQHLGVVV